MSSSGKRPPAATRLPVATLDVVEDILNVARREGFDTLVVAREPWPWMRKKFRHHYCSELIRHAKGLTVWTVAGTIVTGTTVTK